MKIGVLTFHRCINYGSYWQARCLVDGLRARGADVELLDHDALDVRRAEWRCAFQPQLPSRTPRSDFYRYAAKARQVLAAADALPQSRRFALDRPDEADAYDLVLIGSDEVWNFRHPWYGGRPIFFGAGLRAKRLASYAASFGNHDAVDGLPPQWADRLRGFAAISVRDENSRELLRGPLGRDVALVLDPCLQFPPETGGLAPGEPRTLALYGHSFPDWFRHRVRAHADAHGLRVVSVGYRNDWADEQRIEASPEEFSRAIATATAVATNFFHGCVFALVHGRPFACAPSAYRQNKVRDLATLLGTERHVLHAGSTAADLAALLTVPLDPAIAARIGELRAHSAGYLDALLG